MLISTCSRNGESGKLVRTYTGNTIQKEPSKVGIERYCSVPEFDKYEDRHRNSEQHRGLVSGYLQNSFR